MRSGRLRHIVGASELIDSLIGNLLSEVLAALDATDGKEVRCSRRADGAITSYAGMTESESPVNLQQAPTDQAIRNTSVRLL